MKIGIDPGANGAMILMSELGVVLDVFEFSKHTPKDMTEAIKEYKSFHADGETDGDIRAYLEKVSTSPQMGVKSAGTFMEGFGMIKMALLSHDIPFELVTPQTWQKYMGCMTKGDKNVTKAAAQRLFPDRKITHAIADALLIAEYGRRIHK